MPQADAPHGWTADQMPDLSGRKALVTGSNAGLGFETALQLADKGAHVILACRNEEKTRAAMDDIRSRTSEASLEFLQLDLSSLASVEAAAKSCLETHPALDILCNNAGVMALPLRRTADDFEMQLGTNHLGHFALTGRLLPALLAVPGARIVTLSSTAHRIGRIDFDDLQSTRSYARWPAYGQSKLANLLFAYELHRRLERRGADVLSVAAHPGYAATNLQSAGPRMDGSAFMEGLMAMANRIFAQDAAMGALPTLYAATAEGVVGGAYYGPSGLGEAWGPPKRVRSSGRSHDRAAAKRLWKVSEELTSVRFDALD